VPTIRFTYFYKVSDTITFIAGFTLLITVFNPRDVFCRLPRIAFTSLDVAVSEKLKVNLGFYVGNDGRAVIAQLIRE